MERAINIDYDKKIIGAELYRIGEDDIMSTKQTIFFKPNSCFFNGHSRCPTAVGQRRFPLEKQKSGTLKRK